MKLELFKKLLLVAIIGVFVVSCLEDPNSDYEPPTRENELELLSEYIDTLENRGLNIDTTSMGVYYIIDSIGEGELPADGDTCSVKYTGFFVSGQIFDTSGDNTFDVVLGEGSVIDGWEDGLKVFRKNGQGILIIPSEFGYGPNGRSGIPAYTTLLFHIEMVDIKRGY